MADQGDGKAEDGGENTPVTLEEFLVACQKSLARSVRNAQQAGKASSGISQGTRPLYMIDALDIDMSVGLRLAQADGKSAKPNLDLVELDFAVPAEQRSRLRFRVETRAVEVLEGARLDLADLDPLGDDRPRARLRVRLLDHLGQPVSSQKITWHFARAGDKRERGSVDADTDMAGQVDILVDPVKNTVRVQNQTKSHEIKLSGRPEYFVWVTCKRADSWKAVAEQPPGPGKPDDRALPRELRSEQLRLPTG